MNATKALIGAQPVGRHTPAGVNEASIDDYWTAILFESKQPADPKGNRPSTASARAVAKHVIEEGGFPNKIGGRSSPGDHQVREGARTIDSGAKSGTTETMFASTEAREPNKNKGVMVATARHPS